MAAAILMFASITVWLAFTATLGQPGTILLSALFIPYGLSWIAIGWYMRRGGLMAEGSASSS